MTIKPITLFKLLFCALTEVWKSNEVDNLADYLSEALPFAAPEGSFDPAVYDDFKMAFLKWDKGYEEYGYDFVLWYLENIDSYYGDIKSLFLTLPKEEYIRACDVNIALSDDEMIEKYLLP